MQGMVPTTAKDADNKVRADLIQRDSKVLGAVCGHAKGLDVSSLG